MYSYGHPYMAEQKQDDQLEPTYSSSERIQHVALRPEAMNDSEEWREKVRDIRVGGTTWWGWWCWWDFNATKESDQFKKLRKKMIHFYCTFPLKDFDAHRLGFRNNIL